MARLPKRIVADVQPDVHRQWLDLMALQKALDDRTYYVHLREFRANRIMGAAFSLVRSQIVRKLGKLSNPPDPQAIIAAARARGKRKPEPPPAHDPGPINLVRE